MSERPYRGGPKAKRAAQASARQGSLEIDQLIPRSDQPRTEFDRAALEQLTESIRAQGILEPLIVRQRCEAFEIVCGERRYRAALALGLRTVPVRCLELDDRDAFLTAIHENLHRDGLAPLDEARAYRRMLDEKHARSQAEVARLLAVSTSRVSRMLALLDLPADILPGATQGSFPLTERHSRILRKVIDPIERSRLAARVRTDGLSIDELERQASRLTPRKQRGRAPSAWVCMGSLRFRQHSWGLSIEVREVELSQQAALLRELLDRIEA